MQETVIITFPDNAKREYPKGEASRDCKRLSAVF